MQYWFNNNEFRCKVNCSKHFVFEAGIERRFASVEGTLNFFCEGFHFFYNCKHINSFNLLEFFENYEFLRGYFSDFDFRSRVICKIGLYIDMQHISIVFTRVCSLEHLSMAASNVLMIFKKTSFSNMQ